jgi:dihydroneopterin aldolase
VTQSSSRSTEIALVGMRFHVRVGILPHEAELPQPLEIDLRVGHDGRPVAVIDYRRLHELTTAAVGEGPILYLEELATGILEQALAMEGVRWARVAVRKPNVMLGGPLDFAEVALEGANE